MRWEEKYRIEFVEAYAHILPADVIKKSCDWHIDFIKKYVVSSLTIMPSSVDLTKEKIMYQVENHAAESVNERLVQACEMLLGYMKEEWGDDLSHPYIMDGCNLAKQALKEAKR